MMWSYCPRRPRPAWQKFARYSAADSLFVVAEEANPGEDSFTRTFENQPELLEASAADLLPGEFLSTESSTESSE